jgi:hypothetical protein
MASAIQSRLATLQVVSWRSASFCIGRRNLLSSSFVILDHIRSIPHISVFEVISGETESMAQIFSPHLVLRHSMVCATMVCAVPICPSLRVVSVPRIRAPRRLTMQDEDVPHEVTRLRPSWRDNSALLPGMLGGCLLLLPRYYAFEISSSLSAKVCFIFRRNQSPPIAEWLFIIFLMPRHLFYVYLCGAPHFLRPWRCQLFEPGALSCMAFQSQHQHESQTGNLRKAYKLR